MLIEHRGIFASDEWLCDVAGAHRTTIARWRTEQRLPKAVSLLIRLMLDGELELVHPAWKEFRLDRRSGELQTLEGPVRPGEILAIKYQAARLRELERALGLSDLDRFLIQSAA